MNVIRATLNKKSSRGKRGRFRNAPVFHTYFPRNLNEPTPSTSFISSDISTLQTHGIYEAQVHGTAERNDSSSRSTAPAFRTPCLTTFFQNRTAVNDAQISNEFVAECLNTPDVAPTTDSSNSRQKEFVRSVPPLRTGDSGRKPRSSISSGARPRSTPSHSNSGTPKTPRTPRTSKTTSSLESDQNMIIAITEGRGLARGEVGMAAMDTLRPHLILCQISDSQTYASTLTKINVLHANEILVPNTFIENQEENKLFSLIHEHFPQVPITTVQRRHFSDNVGLQHVQSLCLTECANVELAVRQKFYSLSAAAALLKYIEFQKNLIFSPKTLRIDYQSPENVMAIDMKTAQKLELVISLNGKGSECSLLGVLDHCCTIGGRRSLRANILQPPTNLDKINSRLLSVTELAQNPALLHSLQSALSKFREVEQLLWLCVQVPNIRDAQRASEVQTNFVLLLKTTMDSLPVLRESLLPAQTPYFRNVLKDLDDEKFGLILKTILEVVNEDAKTKKGFAASTFQRCFAIKTSVNGMLDLARSAYSDLVAKIHARVVEMSDEYGLVLRTCSTSNKGFHIQLRINKNSKFSAKDLPPVFIQVARTRNLITMTTEELVVMNHRIKQVLREIQILSNIIMQELLQKLRTHISCLYRLCENISELDLIISFAQVSSADNFTPPTFGHKMDIKDSRHPILDVISTSTPVPNDVFASSEKNFHIITGPNMGGKSIYIKQVALLQVMAQIGCFVPAESAELRITKQLFSRLGFDDSIEYNASSFVMEMKEMQYILQSMGPECLIVIDELCRSTDYEEGTAVAWVICEQLLETKAFVFFTTHYLFLTRLQSLYPNVTNHQMFAEDGPQGRLVYTHKMKPGVTKVVMYGLKLAQLSSLPVSVLQRAREICEDLAKDRVAELVHNEEKTEAEEDQEYIEELLELIRLNKFSITEVSKIQVRLRKRYGIDEDEITEEFQGRNSVEMDDDCDESNGNIIQTSNEPKNKPEELRTATERSKYSEREPPVINNSSTSKCPQVQCSPQNSPLLQPRQLRTPIPSTSNFERAKSITNNPPKSKGLQDQCVTPLSMSRTVVRSRTSPLLQTEIIPEQLRTPTLSTSSIERAKSSTNNSPKSKGLQDQCVTPLLMSRTVRSRSSPLLETEIIPEQLRTPSTSNIERAKLFTNNSPGSSKGLQDQCSPWLTSKTAVRSRNSPLQQTQKSTSSSTHTLNFADKQVPISCPQTSQNVQNQDCVFGKKIDSQSGYESCNIIDTISNIRSSDNTKVNEFTTYPFKEPSAFSMENARIIPMSIDSQNSSRFPRTCSTPEGTGNGINHPSTSASLNSAYRVQSPTLSPFTNQSKNILELENQYDSGENAPSFSNSYFKPQNVCHPFQRNFTMETCNSNTKTNEKGSFSKFNLRPPIFPPQSPTVRRAPFDTSSQNFGYEHNSEILSPVLDENSHFQTNRVSSQQRSIWQNRNSQEISTRSPMSSPYPRDFSTRGRLPQRIHHSSPSTSRSNTPMVLSLFPSFDTVPRNIYSESARPSDSDSSEE